MEELIQTKYKGVKISSILGDITSEETDAIVNAANSRLQHGGGVAGAIVRAGGYEIQEESNKIGHVPVGDATITAAGNLKVRFVIHAVGPVWGEGNEDKKLEGAIYNALKIAIEKKLKSISIPAISTGIFGFPKSRGIKVIIDSTLKFIDEHETSLKEIRFCNIDLETAEIFKNELLKLKMIK